jgi:hypothetical protein
MAMFSAKSSAASPELELAEGHLQGLRRLGGQHLELLAPQSVSAISRFEDRLDAVAGEQAVDLVLVLGSGGRPASASNSVSRVSSMRRDRR